MSQWQGAHVTPGWHPQKAVSLFKHSLAPTEAIISKVALDERLTALCKAQGYYRLLGSSLCYWLSALLWAQLHRKVCDLSPAPCWRQEGTQGRIFMRNEKINERMEHRVTKHSTLTESKAKRKKINVSGLL